jgi:hypothetical protein
LTLFVEGLKPGSRGARVACHWENGALVFEANKELRGRWLYGAHP